MAALPGCGEDVGHSWEGSLVFADCPATLPGVSKDRTCATTLVPLRYDEPEAGWIELLVAHYPATTPSQGQLWMLDGGPGGTGAPYMSEVMLPLYQKLGLDIYIPQHRGTGRSTPLACDAPDDLVGCSEALVDKWGKGLQGFSSAAAGEDLGQLIVRAKKGNERVFVLGISYGTYWGQRYLQRYPDQATGVMLDGVAPLTENLLQGDAAANAAGLRLLADCGKNPTCLLALDRDAPATAERVLELADHETTRCLGAAGFTREDLANTFTLMMVLDLPELVPAILMRVNRCEKQDQTELEYLSVALNELLDVLSELDWESNNPALGSHVLRTDLLAEIKAIPLAEMVKARDSLLFRGGAFSLESMADLVSSWTVNYAPVDKTLRKPATPVLLMNGGYDMQTPLPWMDVLAETLDAPAVVFPTAGHAVDLSVSSSMHTEDPCSIQIKRQFVEDTKAELDLSCMDDLVAPDFDGQRPTTRKYSTYFFGTEELLPGFVAARRLSPSGESIAASSGTELDAMKVLRERLLRTPELARRMAARQRR
jgi:pimeloyl-ACP methyl ester carboxylesterase